MKTAKRKLLFVACLLATGFGLQGGSLTWKMELPQQCLKSAWRAESAPVQLTYGFDNSFREHFGQRGIEVINMSVKFGVSDLSKIFNEVLEQPKFGYDMKLKPAWEAP